MVRKCREELKIAMRQFGQRSVNMPEHVLCQMK